MKIRDEIGLKRSKKRVFGVFWISLGDVLDFRRIFPYFKGECRGSAFAIFAAFFQKHLHSDGNAFYVFLHTGAKTIFLSKDPFERKRENLLHVCDFLGEKLCLQAGVSALIHCSERVLFPVIQTIDREIFAKRPLLKIGQGESDHLF